MRVSFGQYNCNFSPWEPRHGVVFSSAYAFDCETSLIPEDRYWDVPDYALGAAFDGERGYFIQEKHLAEFFRIHAGVEVIFHHAPFDLAVINKCCPDIEIYNWVEANRVWDTQLLHRLYCLGVHGHTAGGRGESTLAHCCNEYLGVQLPKDTVDSDGQPVRTSYGKWIGVPPHKIEPVYLEYLAKDVVATHAVFRELQLRMAEMREGAPSGYGFVSPEWLHEQVQRWGPQTHHIQLKGAIVLQQIEAKGLHVNLEKQQALHSAAEREHYPHLESLATFGFSPGKGSAEQLQQILGELESKDPKRRIPRTPKGSYSTKAKDLKEFLGHEPFVRAYLGYRAAAKLIEFIEKMGASILHPSFDPLKVTGRTSSFGEINAQNLPRCDEIRSCFIPSEGHVFIDADYKTLELATLAQACESQFGFDSEMADLINCGADLHRVVAARMTGKQPEEVTADERQKAKAINFGKPGGLGDEALRTYAKDNYGVELTPEEVQNLTNTWLDTFPEMRSFLKDDGEDLGMRIAVAFNLTPDNYRRHTGSNKFHWSQDMAEKGHLPSSSLGWMLRKVLLEPQPTTKNGRAYSPEEVDFFWTQALLRSDSLSLALQESVRNRVPSQDLARAIMRLAEQRGVFTLTGRLRANASYTERHNTVFQGLAADGAKLALWKLWREGFRIVNFVHDEILVEVESNLDLDEATDQIRDLMIEGMREVVPTVKVDVYLTVSSCWSKKAKLKRDDSGKVRVWEPATVQANSIVNLVNTG